jgi:hypothetical protein
LGRQHVTIALIWARNNGRLAEAETAFRISAQVWQVRRSMRTEAIKDNHAISFIQ